MGNVTETEEVSDEQLMVSFVNGSQEAFDELVGRYAGKMTNFVYRQVAHFATAEELAQDAFLAVYRKKHTFKSGYSFSSWLYKIAINLCRMHFRKMKSAPPSVSIEQSREEGGISLEGVLVNGSEGALESLSRKDAEEKLRRAIMELPPKQRQVFTMSFYDEMGYEEIARLLGCSPGTVASRKHAAVQKLASKLRKMAPYRAGPDSRWPGDAGAEA